MLILTYKAGILKYQVVIYVDGIRKEDSSTSLVRLFQAYPKAHMTTEDKALSVEAYFKLTGDTSNLRSFWESL